MQSARVLQIRFSGYFMTTVLQLSKEYRALQTIQMKLILLCVWVEPAILGNTKTALKFKYEI